MTTAALLGCLLAVTDPRAELEALRARKAAEQAAAQVLQSREGSLLTVVEESELAFRAAGDAARKAEAERLVAERRLARARADEAVALSALTTIQEELGPRMRVRVLQGRLSELRMLASSGSMADLLKRLQLWRWVTRHDLVLLRNANEALGVRERARAVREHEASRLASLAREAQVRRDVTRARHDDHQALLATIRGARGLHERAALEAASQEVKLAEFVASLPPRNTGAGHAGFGRLRGNLPRPVDGTIEVGFGPIVDPRFKTVIVQKGLDIRAEAGREVRAVAPGRVAHAGWFKGYGNLVIVDHGEGYHSLVAHLASMRTAMGEDVQAGVVLGTVGDTGSLKGPYLYFEIRERGRPIDPRPWLRPLE